MTDEEALLAAVRAAHDDDFPRLVYADWLEDRGDQRADYVRLEVERHRLRPRDRERRTELGTRLETLRSLADPHWLPRIDRVTRYSFYWPHDVCREAQRAGTIGLPLSGIHTRGNAESYIPRGACEGDYVYVLTHHSRTLHLVGRMRVTHVAATRNGAVVRLDGAEGAAVRLDRPVPPDALPRVGWYSGKAERRLQLTDGGGLVKIDSVIRTLRLLPDTAAEFDALLRDG